MKLIYTSLLIFLMHVTHVYAQSPDSLLSSTSISLITCDPGDEIYSLFGHSAIRIKNTSQNYDVVYNYGTFDFRTPNFTVKFMRGKLPYRLVVSTFDNFLMEYHHFKRGVREQNLQITNDQKKEIIRFLENNAKPENAEYKYDFFFDNCSSRIRDVFENNLGQPLTYSSKEDVTFRDLLHQYLIGWPWTKLGIDMIIGSKADVKASASQQMFLPDKLHDILGNAVSSGKTFLAESYQVLIFDKEKGIEE